VVCNLATVSSNIPHQHLRRGRRRKQLGLKSIQCGRSPGLFQYSVISPESSNVCTWLCRRPQKTCGGLGQPEDPATSGSVPVHSICSLCAGPLSALLAAIHDDPVNHSTLDPRTVPSLSQISRACLTSPLDPPYPTRHVRCNFSGVICLLRIRSSLTYLALWPPIRPALHLAFRLSSSSHTPSPSSPVHSQPCSLSLDCIVCS